MGENTRTEHDIREEHDFTRACLGFQNNEEINWIFIRAVLASVANTTMVPLQDVPGLGSEVRMNLPGTVNLAFIKAAWNNGCMHAEAVRDDAIPSKQGLFRDESRPVKCSECNVTYLLHYDDEAEAALTFCGILAEEIVTLRHPDHAGNVVLDLIALDRAQQGKTQVVWSTRFSLSNLLRKPDRL